MKTKLLLVFLFAVHIAIAQNLVISEIMVNPSGSDSPHEYIEFRGDPGATIAAGTYFLSIEGDGVGTNNPGDVEAAGGGGIIDLSGRVLGSNGYLVLLTTGNDYTVDPNGTVLLDETDGERERGITMDIATRHFETNSKQVTILDAPGHRDFIPNMITGTVQADAALLVINASTNQFEAGFDQGGQTREHAILAKSLGIQQMIVIVNKLDSVDYNKDRFDFIKDKLSPFLKKTGFNLGKVKKKGKG